MMKVQVLDARSPQWNEFLDRTPHDVYHRPEWGLVSQITESGSAKAVLVTGETNSMLCPYIARSISEQDWDATSPYGYPGPLFAHPPGTDFVTRAVAAAQDQLKRAGCVSWFIRAHPILNCGQLSHLSSTVVLGRTVSLDLTLSENEAWSGTSSSTRRYIRRASRSYVIRIEEDCASLPEFIEIYRESMNRLQAIEYYKFTDEYFSQLRDALPGRLVLGMAQDEYGDSVAGCLFIIAPKSSIVQYHLGGTRAESLGTHSSKLIFHEVRSWATQAGYRHLHLGGGLGARDDSLFDFKRSFGGNLYNFETVRIIARPDRYEELGLGRGGDDRKSFFPSYRAPLAPSGRDS